MGLRGEEPGVEPVPYLNLWTRRIAMRFTISLRIKFKFLNLIKAWLRFVLKRR